MKLRSITDSIIVNTSTEEEAKEMYNYIVKNFNTKLTFDEIKDGLHSELKELCFRINDNDWGYSNLSWYRSEHMNVISFAEFKKKYTIDEDELDLVKLLKGHESMILYSLIWGECTLHRLCAANNNGSQPLINIKLSNGLTRNITTSGHLSYDLKKIGNPVIWPNEELYIKYPLNAAKAWKEWEDSQKEYYMFVKIEVWDADGCSEEPEETPFRFKSVEERDDCIEEINAVIKKYRK